MDLHPFQREGVRFLSDRKVALLADEPGLGKTAQAIYAVNEISARCRKAAMRVHVVCPASVCEVWRHHINECASDGPTWCVMSYDMAARNKAQLPIDVLILDEAHYLKNRRAKRTAAIYGPRCDRVTGLASSVPRVFLLTGTPVPNNPSELWPHVRALFSASFGAMSYFQFENHFCKIRVDPWGHRHIEGGRNLAELRLGLSPHILRRKKVDVMSELPPVRFSMLPLPVSQADVRRIAEEAEGFDDQAPPAPTLRRLTGIAKIEPMVGWVQDWFSGGGGKLVLFAHHREVIEGISSALSCQATIAGTTPPSSRLEAVDRFQNDPECRLFIGQLQAAGTGISLTAASTLVLIECSWVPAENEQAAMRIHRIGQRNACDVRFAHAAGTIDTRIQSVALHKMKTISSIYGAQSARA